MPNLLEEKLSSSAKIQSAKKAKPTASATTHISELLSSPPLTSITSREQASNDRSYHHNKMKQSCSCAETDQLLQMQGTYY